MTNETDRTPVEPSTDSTASITLAEDVMLVLFSPHNGTIAGEGTLFYVLGGSVLAELAQLELVSVEDAGLRGTIVSAVGEVAPTDPLLAEAWTYLKEKPRGVQGLLAAIGPKLREPVLDRLVKCGDISRERRKLLGVIPSHKLSAGDTTRRDELVSQVRAVLIDGETPSPRVAALTALVSASGGLPTLNREIPWSSTVATRAKAMESGDWGADAAAAAVARTMTAIVINSTVSALAVSVAVSGN